MNKTLKTILDVAWYLIVFILLQLFVQFATEAIDMGTSGKSATEIMTALQHGWLPSAMNVIVATVISSLLTIAIFYWRRWTPCSRSYIATRPWLTLVWVAVATMGTLIPSIWMQEVLEMDMPDYLERMFIGIMSEPLGYVVIGILAPFVEEMVFRGAILRRLLGAMGQKWHWVAILISAVLFGSVHGNLPQFVHAVLLGLLLGWLYYRTDSIVPGVVLHWVNNTIAYVVTNLMPGMADMKLVNLAGGSQVRVYLWLAFSLCIFLPALFQLHMRLPSKTARKG
uniref:Type II CAAX endopeptidase family protein n=1 Tax=Prevotella sp. GTC17253 TaxID=3236793 RepID=A0AB33IXV8_9BACT